MGTTTSGTELEMTQVDVRLSTTPLIHVMEFPDSSHHLPVVTSDITTSMILLQSLMDFLELIFLETSHLLTTYTNENFQSLTKLNLEARDNMQMDKMLLPTVTVLHVPRLPSRILMGSKLWKMMESFMLSYKKIVAMTTENVCSSPVLLPTMELQLP